jgi:predicted transcriptional regulator
MGMGRVDIQNPRYNDSEGTRVGDGLLHLSWAREALCLGDINRARVEYLKTVESWKQANQTANGQWDEEVSLAKKEYSDFVRNDPLYINGLSILISIIKNNPGILQTELYKQVDIIREDVSYILYFAAEMGIIERIKKGRSYQLRLV